MGTMSRHAFLGGTLGFTVMCLSGCGLKDLRTADMLNNAALSVDEVTRSSLRPTIGAEFEPRLEGTIESSTTRREDSLDVFARAMTAVADTVMANTDDEYEWYRQLYIVELHDAADETYGIPDLPQDENDPLKYLADFASDAA